MNTLYKYTSPFQKAWQRQYRLFTAGRDSQIIFLLTIALVLCIKLFYSSAGPAELRWILFPTTALVNAFSSIHFLFDASKGYVAVGTSVVIGPGCAGLNFYVIALCMSVFSFVNRVDRYRIYLFLGLVLLTYVVTLLVNASRIVAGIMLLELGASMDFAVTGTVHAAQGALFYFFFLVGYFIAIRAILSKRGKHESIY